jgi:hypothetical protein
LNTRTGLKTGIEGAWRAGLPTVRALCAALAVGALAWWLRKGLIEPDAIGTLCASASAPLWCELRHLVVLGFVHNVYGWFSLGTAVLALSLRSPVFGGMALASGMLGCVLYRFDPAGAGLLLAILMLGRHTPEQGQRQQRGKA